MQVTTQIVADKGEMQLPREAHEDKCANAHVCVSIRVHIVSSHTTKNMLLNIYNMIDVWNQIIYHC